MNRVRTVLHLQWRDVGAWFVVPWLILASSFAINILLAALTGAEFTTGGVASLHFAALVVGIVATAQTFPFAIGLGIRRVDYFVGTIAAAAVVYAGTALIITLLSVIESNLTGIWGGKLNFFHLAFLNLSPVALFALHFVLLMALYVTGFFIYSVFARHGRMGMIVMFVGGPIILSIVSVVITRNSAWPLVGQWFLDFPMLAWRFLPVALLLSAFTYMLTRRSTV